MFPASRLTGHLDFDEPIAKVINWLQSVCRNRLNVSTLKYEPQARSFFSHRSRSCGVFLGASLHLCAVRFWRAWLLLTWCSIRCSGLSLSLVLRSGTDLMEATCHHWRIVSHFSCLCANRFLSGISLPLPASYCWYPFLPRLERRPIRRWYIGGVFTLSHTFSDTRRWAVGDKNNAQDPVLVTNWRCLGGHRVELRTLARRCPLVPSVRPQSHFPQRPT